MPTPSLRPSATFVTNFLRNPRQVGAIWPSSSGLGRAMLADAPMPLQGTVVELGPGTGSFTRIIRRHMAPQARYLGIERDARFVGLLREQTRFAQMRFAHGSAEHIEELLAAEGLGKADLIISGLPLILMPQPVMESIVAQAAKVVAPGGAFHTFSYLHSRPLPSTNRLRGLMREHFDTFAISDPVWRNVPPAFVYRGTRR